MACWAMCRSGPHTPYLVPIRRDAALQAHVIGVTRKALSRTHGFKSGFLVGRKDWRCRLVGKSGQGGKRLEGERLVRRQIVSRAHEAKRGRHSPEFSFAGIFRHWGANTPRGGTN